MGQKVNPVGLRVAVNRGWESKWFAEGKEYVKWLHEDNIIRTLLFKELKKASVAKIEIARTKKDITLVIRTARPGMVLGDSGKNLQVLSKKICKALKNRKLRIKINVIEVQKPEINAKLVAENIAAQIVNRASFRTVQKFAIKKAMRSGAKGIKTSVSGRLNGVDMARTEGYLEGNVPLATLRSNVDYALAEALTTYGQIGVKVWIYYGEILPGAKNADEMMEQVDHKRDYKKTSYNRRNKNYNDRTSSPRSNNPVKKSTNIKKVEDK